MSRKEQITAEIEELQKCIDELKKELNEGAETNGDGPGDGDKQDDIIPKDPIKP